MSAILGLVSGATFETESWYNRTNRRRIFRDFPTGHFPLTGLLSMMDDETCDSYKFGWFEKRHVEPESTTKSGAASSAPFRVTLDGTAATSPLTLAAGDAISLTVVDSSQFSVRQVIQIHDLVISGGTASVIAIIETLVSATLISLTVIEGAAAITNTHAANGDTAPKRITVIGNASAEGATSLSGKVYPPIEVENNTQIFRNAFEFTATALKVPTEFDQTGIYAESAEDALREHMTEIEKAFLFGSKGMQSVTIDGVARPRRTTGGLLWYLKEYEKVNSPYRGGSGAAALTLNTNDEKRIINLTGSITDVEFDGYLERAFRVTNNRTFEKVAMCGNGALGVINNYFKTRGVLNKDFAAQKVYGMNVVTWESPWGTIHFKTHPLFNKSAHLRNDMFIIDVNQLKYRYLTDRDTQILPNRQANDFDGRKDEWLTEAGLEVNLPESNMYINNLSAITEG